MSRPRIRTFKPEMWADEKIGQLTRDARLLFVGLVTMADDEGRLRALPALILGHVFPYDDDAPRRLAAWLDEAEASGLVVRYEIAGTPYIEIAGWGKHQVINRPSDSELPPPPGREPQGSDPRGRTDQSLNETGGRTPPRAGARSDPVVVVQPTPVLKLKDDARAARDLFAYWQEKCGHPQAKPGRDRLAKIAARLKEGYTPQQIREGIDGAARVPFVNDAGKRFDDIELICRNGAKLEDFIGRATAPHPPFNGRSTMDDYQALKGKIG